MLEKFKTENREEADKVLVVYTPEKTISEQELIEGIKEIYALDSEKEVYALNLKGLDIDLVAEAVKYALSNEELKDPIMLLNIINLIKTYNALDDSFFENKDIYVSSIEELLDLKLNLKDVLKPFIKQLSIYFISLFKSYNKISYTPTDEHIKLPNLYSSLFLSTDILTLSGIFAISEPFNTNECIYIDESFKYISQLLMKNTLSLAFMNEFLEGFGDGNKSE